MKNLSRIRITEIALVVLGIAIGVLGFMIIRELLPKYKSPVSVDVEHLGFTIEIVNSDSVIEYKSYIQIKGDSLDPFLANEIFMGQFREPSGQIHLVQTRTFVIDGVDKNWNEFNFRMVGIDEENFSLNVSQIKIKVFRSPVSGEFLMGRNNRRPL